MNWHLFGLNPKVKDFLEKHPDKTLLGFGWAMYWRFLVLVLGIELMVIAIFLIVVFGLGLLSLT